MKTCSKCGDSKPLTAFGKHSSNTTGMSPRCKPCIAEDNRIRYLEKREERIEQARWYSIKTRYGLSKEEYLQILEDQKYRCIICEKHQDDCKQRFSVDHNHQTGEIRGLACTFCNHRIIGNHKDPAILRKVADYIEQGLGLFVPPKKKKPRRKRK